MKIQLKFSLRAKSKYAFLTQIKRKFFRLKNLNLAKLPHLFLPLKVKKQQKWGKNEIRPPRSALCRLIDAKSVRVFTTASKSRRTWTTSEQRGRTKSPNAAFSIIPPPQTISRSRPLPFLLKTFIKLAVSIFRNFSIPFLSIKFCFRFEVFKVVGEIIKILFFEMSGRIGGKIFFKWFLVEIWLK